MLRTGQQIPRIRIFQQSAHRLAPALWSMWAVCLACTVACKVQLPPAPLPTLPLPLARPLSPGGPASSTSINFTLEDTAIATCKTPLRLTVQTQPYQWHIFAHDEGQACFAGRDVARNCGAPPQSASEPLRLCILGCICTVGDALSNLLLSNMLVHSIAAG